MVQRQENSQEFITVLCDLARHPNAAVLCALESGARRQRELLAELTSLSENSVTDSLRALDADRLISRRVDPGPPFRVLYELTPLGAALSSALKALRGWTSQARHA
jgi:DNA-binding HxlR family transcriptional regulator